MKKIIVPICFIAGAACFISAGLYINKQNAGLIERVEETESKVKTPELLSDINITSYVCLPASFSNIDIIEDLDDITVTNENVDSVMYEQLTSTASHLVTVSEDNKLLVVDYTITDGTDIKDVQSSYWLNYSSTSTDYTKEVYEALAGLSISESTHVENVSFLGYDGVMVDITIDDIYDMPYPVTDAYVANHTEYSSVYEMRTGLVNDASGEAKEIARQQTIDSLIETMLNQTTFISLPDSLINKELEVLQKDNPNATYEDAKHSLKKIFFIAAVIKDYDVASLTDMEKRYAKLPEAETIDLSDYEIEREKYLLFEEDVVTCIYKKVQITSN